MINSIHKGFSTFFCKFRLSLNCNHVVRISLIRLFRICSQILLNIREHDVFVNSLVFLMTSNKTVQILISIYYIHSGVSPINPDRSMIFYLHDTYDAITTKNFGWQNCFRIIKEVRFHFILSSIISFPVGFNVRNFRISLTNSTAQIADFHVNVTVDSGWKWIALSSCRFPHNLANLCQWRKLVSVLAECKALCW